MNANLVRLAYEWGVRTFGHSHIHSLGARSIRLVEETVELAQAYSVPREQLIAVIERVYSRPHGLPAKEMGGVLVCAAVLCHRNGWVVEDIFVDEMSRVMDTPPEVLAARNREKDALGLTGRL